MPGQLLYNSMYQSLFWIARSKAWSQRITVWTPMMGNIRAMARARRARRVGSRMSYIRIRTIRINNCFRGLRD